MLQPLRPIITHELLVSIPAPAASTASTLLDAAKHGKPQIFHTGGLPTPVWLAFAGPTPCLAYRDFISREPLLTLMSTALLREEAILQLRLCDLSFPLLIEIHYVDTRHDFTPQSQPRMVFGSCH